MDKKASKSQPESEDSSDESTYTPPPNSLSLEDALKSKSSAKKLPKSNPNTSSQTSSKVTPVSKLQDVQNTDSKSKEILKIKPTRVSKGAPKTASKAASTTKPKKAPKAMSKAVPIVKPKEDPKAPSKTTSITTPKEAPKPSSKPAITAKPKEDPKAPSKTTSITTPKEAPKPSNKPAITTKPKETPKAPSKTTSITTPKEAPKPSSKPAITAKPKETPKAPSKTTSITTPKEAPKPSNKPTITTKPKETPKAPSKAASKPTPVITSKTATTSIKETHSRSEMLEEPQFSDTAEPIPGFLLDRLSKQARKILNMPYKELKGESLKTLQYYQEVLTPERIKYSPSFVDEKNALRAIDEKAKFIDNLVLHYNENQSQGFLYSNIIKPIETGEFKDLTGRLSEYFGPEECAIKIYDGLNKKVKKSYPFTEMAFIREIQKIIEEKFPDKAKAFYNRKK